MLPSACECRRKKVGNPSIWLQSPFQQYKDTALTILPYSKYVNIYLYRQLLWAPTFKHSEIIKLLLSTYHFLPVVCLLSQFRNGFQGCHNIM